MNITTIIIISIVFLIFLFATVRFFINEKKNVKQWLIYAITEAEKALGSKTGQLKLRLVFKSFLELFPFFAKFVSFDTFSTWVDIALTEVKNWAESNEIVKNYIKDGTVIKEE